MKKCYKVVIIFAILLINMSFIASAATGKYTTSFKFSRYIVGSDRKMGGNIKIVTNSKKTTTGKLKNSKFKVELYDCGWLWDSYIGYYDAKCEGKTSNGWDHMTLRNYRINLQKYSYDGQQLQGDMTISYSY